MLPDCCEVDLTLICQQVNELINFYGVSGNWLEKLSDLLAGDCVFTRQVAFCSCLLHQLQDKSSERERNSKLIRTKNLREFT
jgi:hypothetical protein